MKVEEYIGSKSVKRFKYLINGQQEFDGIAGELLCKLLNLDWSQFINTYGCALYSDDPIYEKRIKEEYEKFDNDVKEVVGDILPATTSGLKYIEKIGDVLGMIKTRINKGEASYDYFYFVLTNFYDYKQPLFPIQNFNISFLSYIYPLIQEYCPFEKYFVEFNKVISQIENANNVIELEKHLIILRDLLQQEANERKEPLVRAKCNHHSQNICNLIEWYCLYYVDGDGSYLYCHDVEELFDEEKSISINKEELDKLN